MRYDHLGWHLGDGIALLHHVEQQRPSRMEVGVAHAAIGLDDEADNLDPVAEILAGLALMPAMDWRGWVRQR